MKYKGFALFSVFLIFLIEKKKKKESSETNVKPSNQNIQNQVLSNNDEPKKKENRYFVSTDSLKIRDAPNMQGKKVNSLKFGDEITVYKTEGSGEYKNGILDKWCLISENEEQWVNYFYIFQLPAKLEYENKSEIHAYNWNGDINNVYDQLPERFIIEDIIEENNIKYFMITIDDNDYNHNDLHNIKVEMNSVIKNFLPESYSRALRKTADRKLYLDFGSDCWYELGENGEHIIFEEGYLPEGAVKIGENEWLLESSAKNLNIQGLKVQDNISLRKYNFCINSLPILRKNSITENTVLEYGIKLGMSKKDLIDILGLPDKIENEKYLYENYTTGYGDTVIINIVNDKISDISYSIEK